MRSIIIFPCVMIWSLLSSAQNNSEKVKTEIHQLMERLQQAFVSKDREALEQIYAKDFLFIHATGFINNREQHIHSIMEVDSVPRRPIPSMDSLLVFGNAAILRNSFRGPMGNMNVSTSLYIQSNGQWRILQVQGTTIQSERKGVKVETSILDTYTGRYEQSPGKSLQVTRDSDTLKIKSPGQPIRRLIAAANNEFVNQAGWVFRFLSVNGRVTHMIIRMQDGQESKWEKID